MEQGADEAPVLEGHGILADPWVLEGCFLPIDSDQGPLDGLERELGEGRRDPCSTWSMLGMLRARSFTSAQISTSRPESGRLKE